MAEILLQNMVTSNVTEYGIKIEKLIVQMTNFAKAHSLVPVLVLCHILQSKLNLVMGNFDEASKLLEIAHLIALEKGLENYKKQVIEEKSNLDTWKVLDQNSDIAERVRKSDILELLSTRAFAVGNLPL